MADDTKAEEVKPADTRADALKAWHDADSKEKRAAAVKQFPILRTIFADANHE